MRPIRALRWVWLGALSGCTEYTYTSQTQYDVFQQVRRQTVDVLMVVDNSCSMAEEQDKLAGNFQSFIEAFEGIDVDWQIGVVTTDVLDPEHSGRLRGGDDEILLQSPTGAVLDRVAWDRSWPVVEGASLQLRSSQHSLSGNDDPDSWCLSTEPFGEGDLGTPGQPNDDCAASVPPPFAADTGADTGGTAPSDTGGAEELEPPRAGQVIITEFLADPSMVPDEQGEWVELTNISDEDVDLSGCMLADTGRNSFVIPNGTRLSAGAAIVIGRSADTDVNGGALVDVAAGDDMTLNNDVLILSDGYEGALEVFGEMVAVGVTGSGIEMGLEAADLALSDELLGDHNAGLLRDDANLSLIFVSDEDDMSPLGVNAYYESFGSVKGDEAFRDHGVFNVSAVVGAEPPPYDGVPSCETEHGAAAYGWRYVDLASRTGGAVESICDEDFSPIAHELGLTVSGLNVEFELSELCDVGTLEVSLYESPDEESLIAFLVRGEDYDYVPERNAIRFSLEQLPPSETWILAEYRVLAQGAVSVAGEDTAR